MRLLRDDLMDLELEYRLTIAYRINCECAPYLARRREVLMPAMLTEAVERGDGVADVCASFARKLHATHLANPGCLAPPQTGGAA